MNRITNEEWEIAQRLELPFYENKLINGFPELSEFHERILRRGLAYDRRTYYDSRVVELGGGYSSFLTTITAKEKVLVDPIRMPESVMDCYNAWDIIVIKEKAEQFVLNKQEELFDEIWMSEFLQHTQDPILILENLKNIGRTVRFCEAVDTKVSAMHPHTFSAMDLRKEYQRVSIYADFWTVDCEYPYQCGFCVLST